LGTDDVFLSDERHLYDLGLYVERDFDLSRLEAHVKVCRKNDLGSAMRSESETWEDSGLVGTGEITDAVPTAAGATEPSNPVSIETLEKLCLLWMSQKVGSQELHSGRIDEFLGDGSVLLLIAGLNAPTPTTEDRTINVGATNINCFLDSARKAGLQSGDLFKPEDLKLRKNIPQVCRCILLYANRTDPGGLSECMKRASLLKTTLQDLLESCALEPWSRDFIVDHLTNVARSHFRRCELNILLAGSIGSGKSATINSLVGRYIARTNHALSLILSDEEILARDPERGPEIIEERSYERERLQRAHPSRKTESVPFPTENVSIYNVKKNGVLLRLVEIPSTETYLLDEDKEGTKTRTNAGTREKISNELRGLDFNLIFIVERLDSYRSNGCKTVLEELKYLFGDRVWERCILVFTHGYALPPEGLTFEENLARRIHLVQEVAHRVSGRGNIYIPVCVLENSASCAKDATGNLILPNGSTFLDRFAVICENMLLRQKNGNGLRICPSTPSHIRIRHIGFAIASIVILQMLRNDP
jgi:hypothetical protein